MSDLVRKSNGGEILLYQSEDGQSRIECRLTGETLWLTINQMAELFGVDKSGISRHLKNIYETGELQQEATVAEFASVQQEGSRQVSRQLEHYNLDAIISVGYPRHQPPRPGQHFHYCLASLGGDRLRESQPISQHYQDVISR